MQLSPQDSQLLMHSRTDVELLVISGVNVSKIGLERWLSTEHLWVPFQKTWDHFPAPTW